MWKWQDLDTASRLLLIIFHSVISISLVTAPAMLLHHYFPDIKSGTFYHANEWFAIPLLLFGICCYFLGFVLIPSIPMRIAHYFKLIDFQQKSKVDERYIKRWKIFKGISIALFIAFFYAYLESWWN